MKNKRKRLVSILAGIMAGILILGLILGILPSAGAASSSEIRRQINALKQDREDIKTQIADLQTQYSATSDEIADIVARKNIIDQEIGLLHQEISVINDQISAYSLLIADKQDELDQAEARFDQLNADCMERIQSMEEEGTLSYWEVLFKANSFSDLLDRLTMVEEIATSDTRRLQELSDAATAVASARTELEAEKLELEGTRQELDASQQELDVKRQEVDDLISELLAKAAELQLLQEDLEAEDQDLLAEIARKEEEYNEAKFNEWLAYIATATTAAPETTAPAVVISGGEDPGSGSAGSAGSSGGNTGGGSSVTVGSSWIVPTSYNKLTSPFGMRESPTTGASTYHQGVDLSAPAGTSIVASRGGTVTLASYSSSAGYYVTINHGDGFSSIYMHMTNYCVSAGQSVNQGQTIGYVGKTGVATGNHLHFGIAYNGAYVNPCQYVSLY